MKIRQPHFQQQVVHICCFFLLSLSVFAQPQQLSDEAKISVLTCGPGEELYSLFWHTALRIQDKTNQLDVVFNYGTFDFSTPNFYEKFVKGDLMYHLSVDQYPRFVHNYQSDNRSINEQFLNLSQSQKQAVWTEILHQYQSDERFYQYKFIHNNCTTKVADLLNQVLEQPLPIHFKENDNTYRKILNTYLEHHYWEKLGINLIFGNNTDKKNTLVFLPDKLWLSINKAQNNNHPLLEKNVIVYKNSQTPKSSSFNTYAFALIVSLAICFLLFIFSGFHKIWMTILALLGIFFIFIGFYSFHTELLWNTVILMCNPLYILLLLSQNTRWKKIFWYIISALLLLFITLIGIEKIIIFLPLIIISFTALFCYYKNHFMKKTILNIG